MKLALSSTLVAMFVLAGCANPLNRVTSDNYARDCSTAESRGQLKVAEEACYRALVNVDWGNLGQELKSQRQYNLARIKRQLAKFAEAEQLLKESLLIEDKLAPVSDQRIGRRLVELSVNLAGQNKWDEGTQYLQRVLPLAGQFSGFERTYIVEVLSQYAQHFRTTKNLALAEQYEAQAEKLRKS